MTGSRNSQADIKSRIIALDRAWEDAIINSDVGELDRLAADDLVYTHAGCLVEGKEGFIDHIVNGALAFTSVDYEDVEVRVHGDTAVLTCALHLQTLDRADQPGELHFRTTHVWVNGGDAWRLLANQSTFIPETDG